MMTFRSYELVSRALEEGADAGWHRAHKHNSQPAPETIREQIVEAQLLALTEIIDFDPPSADEAVEIPIRQTPNMEVNAAPFCYGCGRLHNLPHCSSQDVDVKRTGRPRSGA
jgi:hypothetical protein